MEKEIISIIVPVYNVEQYLNKCIESICCQSYAELEIILVDDGSTDGCGQICDSWGIKDKRIKVVHKNNGGLSEARNVGIELSSGSWIMFIDSDDFIAIENVEILYREAIDNNCEISVCNIVRVYDDGTYEPFYSPTDCVKVLDGDERFKTLRQPSVCNKLFKRTLFEKVRFPVGKFYEDTFVYHLLAYKANKIVLTGNEGYFYFLRKESILGKPKYTDRYFDFIEAVYMRMTYLLENNVEYYGEEACLSLYAAVSDCEKYVIKTPENRDAIIKMYQYYRAAYKHLIKKANIDKKQKLRLIMLRYFPKLHSIIFY